MSKENLIDFVIPWVDGSDKNWIKEKNKYSKVKIDESNSDIRYRDWGLLKYWFRAIEKNTPWVNKIYFITCNQKPEWLNEKNEKLVLINHEDYIPKECLPTFNVNAIEDNLFRLKDLSENFVYFNDDFFIINEMKKEDFFINGIPRDSFCFNAVSAKCDNNCIEHMILNDGAIIEKYFNKHETIKKLKYKIFNIKYGIKNNLKSLLLLPWDNFTGIDNPHVPTPYIKSEMEKVWKLEEESLMETSIHKFRNKDDINIWIFRYWNLFNGNFIPRTTKKSKFYSLKNDNSELFRIMEDNKIQMICINDSDINLDYESVKEELIKEFEKLYPEKSSFEK